jgi:hypothetical protein
MLLNVELYESTFSLFESGITVELVVVVYLKVLFPR